MSKRRESPLGEKIVLVTGASRGIGRATALACAAAGADVAITYRTGKSGAEAVAQEVQAIGRRSVVLRADATVTGDLERLAGTARKTLGRVDVWINNAGVDILTGKTRQRSRLEKLDLLLAVDLRGTILGSWAAVELMRDQPGGGTIINMAWDHVAFGLGGEPAQLFAAAKGGVASFSKSLARTVAPHIRVNVLAPGWVETAYGEGLDAAVKSRITGTIPLERWGTPQDVAHAVVYLASDAAAYVTGQMLMINGGAVT
jgi:3-oxoacyl-[acyl-carrier protein] reductase